MPDNILKVLLTCKIKMVAKVTSGVIGFLPEETGKKIKTTGTVLMQVIHETIGNILDNEQNGLDNEPKQTSISIE